MDIFFQGVARVFTELEPARVVLYAAVISPLSISTACQSTSVVLLGSL